MISKETFGLRLKELRTLRGLTQPELAERAGLSNWSRVSNWELGYNFPPLNVLCRLAVVLGCSVDYLVGLDEQVIDADEVWLLENYRTLSEEDKELVRAILTARARPTAEE